MFNKLKLTITILVILFAKSDRSMGSTVSPKGNNSTVDLNLDEKHACTQDVNGLALGSSVTLELYEAGLSDNATQLPCISNGLEDYIDIVNRTDFDVNNSIDDKRQRGPMEFTNGLLSKAQYEIARRYILLIFLPLVSLFGIFGNLVSLKCLLKHQSPDSVTVYLCSLAITDTIGLLCFFVEWLPIVLTESNKQIANVVDAYIFIPVKVFLRLSALSSSSYLIVTISIERLLAVLTPLKVKHNCLVRYPKAIASTIIVLVTTFFLVNIWRYEIHSFSDTTTNLTTYTVRRSKSAQEFFNIYGLVAQIVFTFSTMCIVLLCTAFIILILFRQARLRRKMTSNYAVDPNVVMRRVTWMLVTIATIFTVSTLPRCAIGIISKFSKDFKLFSKEHYFVYLMYDVGNLLFAISSSVNFLVYVAFSSRFRGDFINTITCSRTIVVKQLTESSQNALSIWK